MGQTGAAFGAAACKHLAAIRGTHTLTEPVLLGALALLGLIGTDHLGHLLYEIQAENLRLPQQPEIPPAAVVGKR